MKILLGADQYPDRAALEGHLVEHGRNGYRYAPGDTAGLADRLGRLLDDPDRRRRLGSAGRRLARAHDLEATLTAFEGCYAELVEARRPAVGDQAAALVA